MAARAGVTRDDVVAEAVAMLDAGTDPRDVRLGAIARSLGIRSQSLYAHVDGSDGLRRALAVAGLEALEAVVAPAAIGCSGPNGVESIVRAHLGFAMQRPGLYLAAIHPPGNDELLLDAIRAVSAPLEIVLTSLGVDEAEQVHWTRLFLAAVSGFVMLRRDGQLTLPVDADDTAERLVNMLVDQLPVAVR
jgi:AcrR family transcriptional regulator